MLWHETRFRAWLGKITRPTVKPHSHTAIMDPCTATVFQDLPKYPKPRTLTEGLAKLYTGSLLDTILHVCYHKIQEGLKVTLSNTSPTGNKRKP